MKGTTVTHLEESLGILSSADACCFEYFKARWMICVLTSKESWKSEKSEWVEKPTNDISKDEVMVHVWWDEVANKKCTSIYESDETDSSPD